MRAEERRFDTKSGRAERRSPGRRGIRWLTGGLLLAGWLVGASLAFAGPGDCGCMDVVFVIDETDSMSGAIADIQMGLTNIISVAQMASAGDLRLGLVTFKGSILVVHPLTTSVSSVGRSIVALMTGGRGGFPEASDETLSHSVLH